MYSFVYDKISNHVLCCILIYTLLFVFISCRLFDMLVHYSVIYISAYVRNGLNGDSTNIIEAKSKWRCS